MSTFQTFLLVCTAVFLLGFSILIIFGRMAEKIGEVILAALLMQGSMIVAGVGSIGFAIADSRSCGGAEDVPVCKAKELRGERWVCVEWVMPEAGEP